MEFYIENFTVGEELQKDTIKNHINEKFKTLPVKKILLVNPPDVDNNIFDYSIAKRGRSNNYPAYGLGVLAKNLQLNNFDVTICNLNHEVLKAVVTYENETEFDYDDTWQNILDDCVDNYQPDLIAITCIFSVTHTSFAKVCQHCKTSKKSWYPGGEVPLVIGGVHVTHDLENILQKIPQADYIFLNEAEIAFVSFLKFLNGEGDSSALGQMVFRFPHYGLRFLQTLQPEGDDLNIVPAFELMDIKNHSKVGTLGSWYGFLEKDTPIGTVQSNRGCRAACTFCNVRTFHGVGVRQRSVESVIEELTILHEQYGIKHIIWLDDDLLKNETRAVELFNRIVQKNLKLTWDATNGVIARSLLKEEVMIAATESGCIGLNIGIESGNPEILRHIKKPGKVDTFIQAAEMLHKYPQINARALLIIGFPNETLGMIFDTIKLSEEMNLDWHNLSILQPWKNTPIYDSMVEEGLLGEEEGTLKTDDNKTAPYMLGTYSRQRAIEKGLIQQSIFGEKEGRNQGFLDRIKIANFNEVPDPRDLDDIWFYMNMRLNFSRLFREQRKIKLEQQQKFLKYVSNKTAPDNALIIYFYAFLQEKMNGEIDENVKNKLYQRLSQSEYWRERFRCFGMSYEQVRDGAFPDRIEHGGIPKTFMSDPKVFDFPTEEITS